MILAMGNYMNKGNQRVGEAAGFKISFISQVGQKKYFIKMLTIQLSIVGNMGILDILLTLFVFIIFFCSCQIYLSIYENINANYD